MIHHRICKREECGLPFETKHKNKDFCTSRCALKDWQKRNPRIYNGVRPNDEAHRICGNDLVKRDSPEKWLSWIHKNPLMFPVYFGVEYSYENVKTAQNYLWGE